jgi:hypothetical protein
MSERWAELDALALVVQDFLKERDADLLGELTVEQTQEFRELQGKPLAIAWPKHDMVFGDPFE